MKKKEMEKQISSAFDDLEKKLEFPDFKNLGPETDPEKIPQFFDDLFVSKEGRILGDNSKALGNFILNTAMLTLPVDKLMGDDIDVIQGSPDHRKLIAFQRAMDFQPLVPALLRAFPLIPTMNIERFYALHILSLSAYIDAYVSHLISNILEDTEICYKLIAILEKKYGSIITVGDLQRSIKEESKALSRIVNRHAPRGTIARLDIFLEAYGIRELVQEITISKELNHCRSDLSRFIEIRGKVAHATPNISAKSFIEEFRDETLEKSKGYFDETIATIYDSLKSFPLADNVKSVFQSLMNLTIMTALVPFKALSYLAVMDRVFTIVRPDLK